MKPREQMKSASFLLPHRLTEAALRNGNPSARKPAAPHNTSKQPLGFIVQGDTIAGPTPVVGIVAIEASRLLQSRLAVVHAVPQLGVAFSRPLQIALLLAVELLTGRLTSRAAGQLNNAGKTRPTKESDARSPPEGHGAWYLSLPPTSIIGHKPLHVLQVSPYFPPTWAYGGIPRIVHGLSRALVQRGHRISVWTTDAFDAKNKSGMNGIHIASKTWTFWSLKTSRTDSLTVTNSFFRPTWEQPWIRWTMSIWCTSTDTGTCSTTSPSAGPRRGGFLGCSPQTAPFRDRSEKLAQSLSGTP